MGDANIFTTRDLRQSMGLARAKKITFIILQFE